MTYELRKITEEDKQKILEDAKCNEGVFSTINYALQHREFTEAWAINEKGDSYMLLSPMLTREEATNVPYFIFYNNEWIKFFSLGWFGNKFYFDTKVINDIKNFKQLEVEITAAFEVYGRNGTGPFNEFGNPEFAITPEFESM